MRPRRHRYGYYPHFRGGDLRLRGQHLRIDRIRSLAREGRSDLKSPVLTIILSVVGCLGAWDQGHTSGGHADKALTALSSLRTGSGSRWATPQDGHSRV